MMGHSGATPTASAHGFWSFLRRNRHERAGYMLYGAAVAAARQPSFYAALGVPDTLDGRFDLVGLHVFLLIRRLTEAPPPGPALAQAVFDAMFNDMDLNLREIGVGDLSVGRRVREMWEAFHGRAAVYAAALDGDDPPAALAEALVRNVWRGGDAAGAPALASRAIAVAAHLAAQTLPEINAGRVNFAA